MGLHVDGWDLPPGVRQAGARRDRPGDEAEPDGPEAGAGSDISANLGEKTEWAPIYRDTDQQMFLLNRKTGAIRAAPWIAMRAANGAPYFVNIWTNATRWIPPLGWMDGWCLRSYRPHMSRWHDPEAMRAALATTKVQLAWHANGPFNP